MYNRIIPSRSTVTNSLRHAVEAVRRLGRWCRDLLPMAHPDGHWPRTEHGLGREMYAGYGRMVSVESDARLWGRWRVFQLTPIVYRPDAGLEDVRRIELTDEPVGRQEAAALAEQYMSDIAHRDGELGPAPPGDASNRWVSR